jgi:uncharacterized coiled-coil DUF342 family protein
MNKKNVRYQPTIVSAPNKNDDEDPIVSQRLLQAIQHKLDKAAALNGGFDKLLYKIDSIENNQQVIGNKVDKIHEAIYDPDEGLFARISSGKVENHDLISNVEKKVVEISTWKDQQKKDFENQEENIEKFTGKINTIENSIENLNKFQTATVGLAKWFGAAAGGGLITILFKVFYDYVIIK